MIDVNALLKLLVDSGGSDLHLKVGVPPIIRVDGELRRLDHDRVTQDETESIARVCMPSQRRAQLMRQNEADFGYTAPGLGRFRVNVFHQRGSTSIVFRGVRLGGRPFEELGLPASLRDFADYQRGMVIVAGPTGSGKTTTLAAMVEYINQTKPVHILTLEDPIEILHRDQVATVNQREIGVDTMSYADGLRAAMRQDPDVMLIGEMRDPETAIAALSAAETGHLVLTTLHTSTAVETVNRLVDFFPLINQHQIRVSLANSLISVICQRLLRSTTEGRVPAVEVLVNNGRVAERIVDPLETAEINEIISKGESWGMQSFDQSLLALVQQGRVSVDDAYVAASNAHDFALMLQQAGLIPINASPELRRRRREAMASARRGEG